LSCFDLAKGAFMKVNEILLFSLFCLFSNQSMALFQGGFEYKEITENLQPSLGCKNKKVATKQAYSDYRFNKQSKVLCQQIGYGWRLDAILDKGNVVCEPCEDQSESTGNYQCYIENVKLKCGLTKRGW